MRCRPPHDVTGGHVGCLDLSPYPTIRSHPHQWLRWCQRKPRLSFLLGDNEISPWSVSGSHIRRSYKIPLPVSTSVLWLPAGCQWKPTGEPERPLYPAVTRSPSSPRLSAETEPEAGPFTSTCNSKGEFHLPPLALCQRTAAKTEDLNEIQSLIMTKTSRI